jgi:hypothetical protein
VVLAVGREAWGSGSRLFSSLFSHSDHSPLGGHRSLMLEWLEEQES